MHDMDRVTVRNKKCLSCDATSFGLRQQLAQAKSGALAKPFIIGGRRHVCQTVVKGFGGIFKRVLTVDCAQDWLAFVERYGLGIACYKSTVCCKSLPSWLVLLSAILLVFQAHDGFRSHSMLVFPGVLLISPREQAGSCSAHRPPRR